MPKKHTYSVNLKDVGHAWSILFTINEPFHTLDPFPHALEMLSRYLPIIMTCECDNGCNHSFADEVPHTETGHLLEHILLEYLCEQKLNAGFRRAEFSGRTSWNWVKEKRGTFHIVIQKNSEDAPFLNPALHQSLSLLDRILTTKQPAIGGLN